MIVAPAGAIEGVQNALGGSGPTELGSPQRTGGGEAGAKLGIADQAVHGFGDGGGVVGVEFEGRTACDTGHRLDIGAGGGKARCEGFHYWEVDWDHPEPTPGGAVTYPHRCRRCGLEVHASDIGDAATKAASLP